MSKRTMLKSAVTFALMATPLMSQAEVFSFESEKIKGLTYSFDIPRGDIKVVNKDGKPWVLGEGSMGIAIAITVGGKEQVLKYFKTNEYFPKAQLKEYEILGKLSVIDSSQVSDAQMKYLQNAEGAAEDVVFGAQQFGVRSKYFEGITLNEILYDHARAAKKMKNGTFALGTVDVEPIDMTVTTTQKKVFKNKVVTKKVTGLIKPFLKGMSLKKLLETNGQINETKSYDLDELAESVCKEVILMSNSELKFDDLNEANWIVLEKENGSPLANPFDMKPGERVEGGRNATIVANFVALKNKITPYGLSSGAKRDRLIKIKHAMKAGLFHAMIAHDKSDAIDTLKNRIDYYIDLYSN